MAPAGCALLSGHVGRSARAQRLVDVPVQELELLEPRQLRLVKLLARRVMRQRGLLHRLRRGQQRLQLVRALLQLHAAAAGALVDVRLGLGRQPARALHAQLGERGQQQRLDVLAGLLARHQPHQLGHDLLRGERARPRVVGGQRPVLAQHPHQHLQQHVGQPRRRLGVQQARVDVDRGAVQRLVLLRDQAHERVRERGLHVVAAQLKHLAHHADEPRGRGRVALSKLRHLARDVAPDVLVGGCAQVAHHALRDDLHVVGLGHLVQQLQRLELERVVGVLQAVHHRQLVLLRVLRVDLDDARQRVDAHVAQVVRGGLEEGGDGLSGRSQQVRVGVDGGDGAHALVDDGVADGVAAVGAAQRLLQHRVHVLARHAVARAQHGQDLEQLDLDEGRREAVVIVRLGQAVLRHLLEDGGEGGDEVLVGARVLLDHLVQRAQRRAHHAGVLVAQHGAEVLVQIHASQRPLMLGVKLVEPVQRHDRLLPHMLLGVA
mmetsp:Transcript_12356/g.30297  ORF Transcript_12356/g.30297 Transcript_12356/m.30297 type:complete len:490 (-) Transcript_12356:565-2034(-)